MNLIFNRLILYSLCTHFALYRRMAIIPKGTKGMIQESTVTNNCNLFLLPSPQPETIKTWQSYHAIAIWL